MGAPRARGILSRHAVLPSTDARMRSGWWCEGGEGRKVEVEGVKAMEEAAMAEEAAVAATVAVAMVVVMAVG